MPKHQTEIGLQNLSAIEYLHNAKKTVEHLGWKVMHISGTELFAESPMSWKSNTWGETIVIKISGSQATISSTSKGNTLMDFGRNRKNVEKFLEKFEIVEQQPATDEDNRSMEEMAAAVEQDSTANNEAEPAASEKWWRLFVPRKGFFVTPILLHINIVLFIAMVVTGADVFAPSTEKLIEWGANVKYLTNGEGEWWRLFTCMFLHIGIIHLALNMYALLYIGLYVETLLGSARFAACYLATGLLASLTSLWWHDNVASAGASGAIFGMYGVFLALLTTNMIEKSTRSSILSSIAVFVVYNLVNGMKGGIDNAAHIGGLVSGIVIGYVTYFMIRSNAIKNKLAQAVVVIVIGIIALLLTLPAIKDPYTAFTKTLQDFGKYEYAALKYYELPDETADSRQIIFLHDEAIPNWQRCKKELARLDGLDLPAELERRKVLLNDYVDQRILLSQKLIEKLGENTNRYDEVIEGINSKIENIIKELNGGSQ